MPCTPSRRALRRGPRRPRSANRPDAQVLGSKRSTSSPSSRRVADEVARPRAPSGPRRARSCISQNAPCAPAASAACAARSACGCLDASGSGGSAGARGPRGARARGPRRARRRGSTGTRSRRTRELDGAVAPHVVGHAGVILRSRREISRSRSRWTAFISGVVISPSSRICTSRARSMSSRSRRRRSHAPVSDVLLGHAVAALAGELVGALRVERARALDRRLVDLVVRRTTAAPRRSSAASIVRNRAIAWRRASGSSCGKCTRADERRQRQPLDDEGDAR